MSKLYLIDGYSWLFRAYHSLPPLTNPEGTPVGAVYGFANMIMQLRDGLTNDDSLMVVFDAGKKSFRNDIYPEYKANRPEAPEDLIPQFTLVRELVDALNIPHEQQVGFEADDIIATYAKHASEDGFETYIVSSDKDLMQLVNENTFMVDTMKKRKIGIEEVKEKFGVTPRQVLDVLALMGDSSDNIPGVPSIGPKTAAELLNTYDNLEGIFANLDKIKQNKRREVLTDNQDQAYLSRKLASLCFDTPQNHPLNSLKLRDIDNEIAIPFLQKHGFKSVLKKLGSEVIITAQDKPKKQTQKLDFNLKKHVTISNKEELEEYLKNSSAIYLIINNNILYLWNNSIQSVEIELQNSLFDSSLDYTDILKPYLRNKAVKKVLIDSKSVSHFFDINIQGFEDISVLNYSLYGTSKKLDLVEEKPIEKFKELFEKYHELKGKLLEHKAYLIYESMEKPIAEILYKMESRGIKIDVAYLQDLTAKFNERSATLSKDIYKLAGQEFLISSPKQLGEVLFDNMGLEGGKKSKKSGAYSTSADVLEKLEDAGYIIATKVIQYRSLTKLVSTFTEPLTHKASSVNNHRVHTTFGNTTTATGRLSSLEPNLQNIPIRTEDGKLIRGAFIAKEGHKLVAADYSQIELRLLAHMAQVPELIEAFKQGQDIHAITAAQVLGADLDNMDKNLRRDAKAVNFGIIYGQSAYGLAKQLGIGNKEAADIIDRYFTQYTNIRKYMDKNIAEARENGYVSTICNRRIYFKDINSKMPMLRQFAERAAINAPLQGTAADIMKIAMIQCANAGLLDYMVLQIHDELLLEVPEDKVQEVADKLTKTMQNVMHLDVPLTVNTSIGNNWLEL